MLEISKYFHWFDVQNQMLYFSNNIFVKHVALIVALSKPLQGFTDLIITN